MNEIEQLQAENKALRELVSTYKELISELENRCGLLESKCGVQALALQSVLDALKESSLVDDPKTCEVVDGDNPREC